MAKKLNVLNSYATFEYTPEMIKESRMANDGKIFLKNSLCPDINSVTDE